MSRFHLSSWVQSVLSVVFGLLVTVGTPFWVYYIFTTPNWTSRHVLSSLLVPPILCGLLVGLFFRQRFAKIISIVFTMLLSFLYPIYTIYNYAFLAVIDDFAIIASVFAGNLLFVGIIKLINFIFFRLSSSIDESSIFSRNWYRFKEGKFFFATWVHFSILRLAPLIFFMIQGAFFRFFAVLAVFLGSISFSIFSFITWRVSRNELYPPDPTEQVKSKTS